MKRQIKLTPTILREMIEESIRGYYNLNESKGNRIQVSKDDILDLLKRADEEPGGKFATITYVMPKQVYKTKRSWRADDVQKALDKNSDRSGEDWYKNLSAFNQEGAKGKNPISFVVVAKRFLFNWHTKEDYNKDYDKYSEELRNLRMRNGIGLDSNGVLGDNHNQRQKFDYAGQQNQTGKLSRDFNMARGDQTKLKTKAFFCDEKGDIVAELPGDVLNSMLAPCKDSTVEAAVSNVLTGEALEAYREAKKELDKTWKPKNLVFDQVLSIALNVNGQSYYFINDALAAPIAKGGGVNVNQQTMIEIAKDLLGETFDVMDNFATENHNNMFTNESIHRPFRRFKKK